MRTGNRLTDVAVRAANAKGRYPDANGVYLQVAASGTKSWIFRCKRDGRPRDMGLEPLRDVSLARNAGRHNAAGSDYSTALIAS